MKHTLSFLFCLLVGAGTAAAQQRRPAYDSTNADYARMLPPGMSHKTAQQAAVTFGRIGAGQALDRLDSLFLMKWRPGYLTPVAPEQPNVRPRLTPAPPVQRVNAKSRPN